MILRRSLGRLYQRVAGSYYRTVNFVNRKAAIYMARPRKCVVRTLPIDSGQPVISSKFHVWYCVPREKDRNEPPRKPGATPLPT